MALTANEAAAADDIVDRTVAAACLQVTLEGGAIDDALVGHFAYLREGWPATYGLVVLRLHEIDSTLLAYTTDGGCDD